MYDVETEPTFNNNWYLVIRWTGFSMYAANGNLWPNLTWQLKKYSFLSPTFSRSLSDFIIFWQ